MILRAAAFRAATKKRATTKSWRHRDHPFIDVCTHTGGSNNANVYISLQILQSFWVIPYREKVLHCLGLQHFCQPDDLIGFARKNFMSLWFFYPGNGPSKKWPGWWMRTVVEEAKLTICLLHSHLQWCLDPVFLLDLCGGCPYYFWYSWVSKTKDAWCSGLLMLVTPLLGQRWLRKQRSKIQCFLEHRFFQKYSVPGICVKRVELFGCRT